MRRNIVAAASLLALAASVAPTAAQAEETPQGPGPEVSWVGDNVVVSADRGEASVLAKFRCYGGEEGTHLWASVKRGENLQAEGSGGWATSWYDTNYQYQDNPAGQTIQCDGRWHATRFTVKRVEGKGTLDRGPAWVQFCVFDSRGGFASVNGYKSVRVGT
jgi:hypothetical protein